MREVLATMMFALSVSVFAHAEALFERRPTPPKLPAIVSEAEAAAAPELATTAKAREPRQKTLARMRFEELSGVSDPASTAEFMRQAAMSATLEARASRIALEASASPHIRALAQERIAAARETHRQLAMLARDGDVGAVPLAAFDANHAARVSQLAEAPRDRFDQAFLELIADSQTKAARYSRLYAGRGEHPDLQRFAQSGMGLKYSRVAALELTKG